MHQNGTILAVDDNPILLKGMHRILESAGYHVLTASTGGECLAILREIKPDMVLLDVVLPDGSGFEICKEIKSRTEYGNVYVVLLSSLKTSSDDQAEGLETGADGYIARPISNRELLARIQALLRLKWTETKLRESQQNFLRTFDESPVGSAIVSLEQKLELINKEMCRMTGHTREHLLSLTFDELLHPEDVPSAKLCIEKLLAGETEVEAIEVRLGTKEGAVLWARISLKLMRDISHTPLYYLPIIEDITERKRSEQERERLVDELRKTLSEAKRLSGLLPICASCKKIRDDKGYWEQVETYVSEHSDAVFSHGICPECAKKLYPEYFLGPERKESGRME